MNPVSSHCRYNWSVYEFIGFEPIVLPKIGIERYYDYHNTDGSNQKFIIGFKKFGIKLVGFGIFLMGVGIGVHDNGHKSQQEGHHKNGMKAQI